MGVEATLTLQYYNGSNWVSLNSYAMVGSSISADWGMRSDEYDDRLASVGGMTFTLRNTSGEFDPDDADVLTGWAKNTKVRWLAVYDGVTYVRFYGTVNKIDLVDSGTDHTAKVSVVDWMNYAYKYPLAAPSIQLYKRGDEAIDTIVDAVGKTPLATSYSEGINQFPAVFDTTGTNTKAAGEINKIVLSEMGYFYARKNKENGETLVFESAIDRNGYAPLKKLPKLAADCGFLLLETGDKLLLETGDKLILDEAEDAHINGTAQGITRAYGEDIVNRVTISAYPKEVDTTEAVLYTLESPIKLAAGEVKTVRAGYYNATTKKNCNAISDTMVAPVATTDYAMNRKADGTGADLTSSLTVTAAFGTEAVSFTLTNASTYTGHVTALQCRGYGVYQDTELEEILQDTASETAYEVNSLNLDQKYTRDTAAGAVEGKKILQREKDPRTVLQSVSMTANTSSQHMMAFLSVDVGDLVEITQEGKTGYYYVQGVSFTVSSASVIKFKWGLKEAMPSVANGGLTAVTIETTGSSFAVVDYGVISRILDTNYRTVAFSCYLPSSITDDVIIVGLGNHNYTDRSGSKLFMSLSTTYLRVQFVNYAFEDGVGDWVSNNLGSMASIAGNWFRIVMTYEPKKATANPVFYYNGTATGLSSYTSPSGDHVSEDSFPLVIGGIRWENTYYENLDDVSIKNVCIYDRILTAAEITADAAGTISTDGLIFFGPCAPTESLSSYYDAALTESQVLFDSYGYEIGTPKNAPTCREI